MRIDHGPATCRDLDELESELCHELVKLRSAFIKCMLLAAVGQISLIVALLRLIP